MHSGSHQTLFTASSRACTLSEVSNSQWWNKHQGKRRKLRARMSFHLIWKGGRWTTCVRWTEPRRSSNPTPGRCQGISNSRVKGLYPLDISTYNTTIACREVIDLHPTWGHSIKLSGNPVEHCEKQSFYYCFPTYSYKTHSAHLVTEYNSPFLFLAPQRLKSVEQNRFLCHQCSGETINFKDQGCILTHVLTFRMA